MAEAIGDGSRINACGDQMRGVTVSHVMEMDIWEFEPQQPRGVVAIPDVVWMNRATVKIAEHEPGVCKRGTHPEPLLTLPQPEPFQNVDHRSW